MSYKVKLQSFEGPFDLLVYLIENAEMSIYDIRISEITNQYLEYIKAMEERRKLRASILYDVLDNSKIYKGHADKDSRSCMNVTFRTLNDEMDREFIEGAKCKGLVNLKGHRLTGGIRASIYNSMPVEGVELLRDYMKEFECKAGI